MGTQAETAPRDSPANVLVHNTVKQIELANQDTGTGADLDVDREP